MWDFIITLCGIGKIHGPLTAALKTYRREPRSVPESRDSSTASIPRGGRPAPVQGAYMSDSEKWTDIGHYQQLLLNFLESDFRPEPA